MVCNTFFTLKDYDMFNLIKGFECGFSFFL